MIFLLIGLILAIAAAVMYGRAGKAGHAAGAVIGTLAVACVPYVGGLLCAIFAGTLYSRARVDAMTASLDGDPIDVNTFD